VARVLLPAKLTTSWRSEPLIYLGNRLRRDASVSFCVPKAFSDGGECFLVFLIEDGAGLRSNFSAAFVIIEGHPGTAKRGRW
jgi:hypothetical protein